MKCGSATTNLIVLRGNSGSGKSTIAERIRAQRDGVAIIGQDHLRRVILKEKDRPGAANIGLIDLLSGGLDQVLTADLSADAAAARILGDAELASPGVVRLQ